MWQVDRFDENIGEWRPCYVIDETGATYWDAVERLSAYLGSSIIEDEREIYGQHARWLLSEERVYRVYRTAVTGGAWKWPADGKPVL